MKRPRHPWAQWFNGATHIIERGKDFDLPPDKMRAQIFSRAADRGVCVHAHVEGDRVALRSCGAHPRYDLDPTSERKQAKRRRKRQPVLTREQIEDDIRAIREAWL